MRRLTVFKSRMSIEEMVGVWIIILLLSGAVITALIIYYIVRGVCAILN